MGQSGGVLESALPEQIRQRLRHARKAVNEPSVVADHGDERPQFRLCRRNCPLLNGLDLSGLPRKPVLGKAMAQEVHLRLIKLRLGQLESEFELSEAGHDGVHQGHVLLPAAHATHQDVVDVRECGAKGPSQTPVARKVVLSARTYRPHGRGRDLELASYSLKDSEVRTKC